MEEGVTNFVSVCPQKMDLSALRGQLQAVCYRFQRAWVGKDTSLRDFLVFVGKLKLERHVVKLLFLFLRG